MDEHESELYDVVVTALFVVGIGLNVYLMVDAATNGELTRQVAREWTKRVREPWERWRTFEQEVPKVVPTATWFAYEAAQDMEGDDK